MNAGPPGSLAVSLRRWGQLLFAPGADRRLGQRLRALAPGRTDARAGLVLDIGSGSESRLSRLGARSVAVDVSPARASAAARAGAMAVVASAVALPFRDDSFQGVAGVGLLHHLSDDDAARAVREMIRVTATDGQTIVLDAVVPETAWRRPIAALIRRVDRGRWMRRQQHLESLLGVPHAWTRERFTDAHTGLEAMLAIHRKRRT
jgi:SAM-dependent methyltransferase